MSPLSAITRPLSPSDSTIYEQLGDNGPGYVHFRGEEGIAFPPGMRDRLNELKYEPIPNAPNLSPGDGKRQQCKSTGSNAIRECKSLLQSFSEGKGLLDGGKTLVNVRSLRSDATPGYDVHMNQRQPGDGPDHADAAAPGSLRGKPVRDVPCSLIGAVEEGSRLRIQPFGEEWITVHLKPGDVLVFRGDLLHSGVGYDTPNIRIHAYIDSPVIKRKTNFLFSGSVYPDH